MATAVSRGLRYPAEAPLQHAKPAGRAQMHGSLGEGSKFCILLKTPGLGTGSGSLSDG